MKIRNLLTKDILSDSSISSNFLSVYNNRLKLDCKIYKGNFYSDSYNYFPITKDEKTFLDLYSWGKKSKHSTGYTRHSLRTLEWVRHSSHSFSF